MNHDMSDPDITATGGIEAAPRFSMLFAASAERPRVRRTLDSVVLVAGLLVVALAGWAAREETDVEKWVDSIVQGSPGWVTSLAGVVFAGGGILMLAMVVIVAVRRDRLSVARDMLVAGIVAFAGALVAGRVFLGDWPNALPEFHHAKSFPILRLAAATAVLSVARPAFTAPMRRLSSQLVALMSVSAVVLEFGSFVSVIAAWGVGVAAAGVVRLIFGTTDGVPSLDRIRAALLDLGLETDHLEYMPDPPIGCMLIRAADAEGWLDVKVYGRDSADSALAARVWRSMWFRGGDSMLGVSRRQQSEHEALVLLMAAQAGRGVPRVVVAGTTATGDALVVTRPTDPEAPVLHDLGRLDDEVMLTAAEFDDDVLDALWSEVLAFHAAGIAVRALDPRRITIGDATDGARVELHNLAGGVLAPSERTRSTDVAELLVLSSVIVGEDRAVAAAIRHCDADVLNAAMPMMQRSGVSSDVAEHAKRVDLDLDDLRKHVATEIDIEPPKLAQLRRVKVSDIVMLVLLLFAINAMLAFFAEIDWAQFRDEISNASIGFILIAFVLAQTTNIAETLSLSGVVTVPIPWGPTLQFQYASSYIALAVPSDAGRIAMTIRYLQKLGVPTHVAVGQGPFTTVFGYLIDAVLLAITYAMVGSDLDFQSTADTSGLVKVAVIVVLAAVLAVLAVLLIPTLRRRVLPKVIDTLHELKGSLTDPDRAARLIGGLVAKKFLFALAFATVASAYGYPISFATAIFINTCVSWFAGLIPVPGGIGVTEAAFTAGLVAFGVPQSAALAIAITYRICTNYFPPVPGYFMMSRLERNGYL
jgi:glycosyltransferase 2 family protein